MDAGAARAPLPPSLWAATAAPAAEASPLAGERKADVVVIGGGFCGMSCALHLAEAGVDTVVLESQEPGWGASGRNGGQIIPCFKDDPDTLVARHGTDLGERMNTLGASAGDVVADLVARHEIDCDYRQNGWVLGVHGRGMQAALDSRARQWQARGLPVQRLDKTATADLLGTDIYESSYLDPRGGAVNPLSFARGLAKAAIRCGAAVHAQAPVTAITREGTLWRVSTPHGAVLARTVVIATGAYTGEATPTLKRSILPVQSIQVATEPLSSNVRRTILPHGHVASDTRRLLLYCRFGADNRLVFGGRGSISGDGIAEGHIAAIVRAMQQTFPQVGSPRIDYVWAGHVDITVDRRLRVHELGPGLVAVIGFNGRGVALAPAVGKAVADALIKDSLKGLPLPVTPVRPVPLHGLRLPAMAIAAQWYRFRDRLDARR
jgi:glycine/D-amino acid oxidase-like deaminating enzyme